jgi:hypothetical protein
MSIKNLTSLFRKLDYIFTDKVYYVNSPVFIGRNYLSDYNGEDWKIYIPKKEINLKEGKYNRIYIPYPKQIINRDFELLLICWYPNVESPIHNHSKNGCAMKILEGELTEIQYNFRSKTLTKTLENKMPLNTTNYTDSKYYYHKIINRSDKISYSLHLYSPPNQITDIFGEPKE